MRAPSRTRQLIALGGAGVLAAGGLVLAGPAVAAQSSGSRAAATQGAIAPTYRANDYADGQALSILPPGENGLVNATDLLAFEAAKTRPPNSTDQRSKYDALNYGAGSVTNANLTDYYNDESFGVKPADITRTETPGPGVTIYRDTADVPHVYGSTDETMSFGAGYAQAEDRLFLMDVLRHYGAGTTSAFLGPSCADEQMDHDQLLLAPYTPAQAQAQVDALPAEYGAQGQRAKDLIDSFVQGINAYVTATRTNPKLLPADYGAVVGLPQRWVAGDVVSIAGLIGGIFGKGGGIEVANAALLQYLDKQLGTTAGAAAFTAFREQNDPAAPTTITDKAFPYETPGTVDPATTALPTDASADLTGGPTDTTMNCDPTTSLPLSSVHALATIASLQQLPKAFSNALVVNANHSASGHPIAVFGPQVSYFAPQILMEEDLHSPTYAAEGASFPGTGIVELGRGEDFAWSATSAGTDLVDQRLETICNPNGGTPDPEGKYYLFGGQCLPMTNEDFTETGLPKPAGPGAPVVLDHQIHLTRHGVVQGWTTSKGHPVAVVNQRSTYTHDIDSVVGFLRWGTPSLTDSPATWFVGAEQIEYTFNWFYVDSKHTAYYVSGLDPLRPASVDPNLPSSGTGNAEWTGYLSAAAHPHEIDPPQGYFVSWNNKPAAGFSAADDQYGYGATYRSQLLTAQLADQFAAHGGKITRAELVQAMEFAATQDLDGVTELPQLLAYVKGRTEPAGVTAMLAALQSWTASGAHRQKAAEGDTQYKQAAAVAIADEVVPNLVHAVYDRLLSAGGSGVQGSTGGAATESYTKLPMQFVNTPNSGGAHLGSAYDAGWEGYLQTTLQQLRGQTPADAFPSAITNTWCGGGPTDCPAAIDQALRKTYDALVAANGSSAVSDWTQSSDSKAAGQTMPVYDSIAFKAVGVVGQDNLDWQNRPTFQQVIEYPRHRSGAVSTPVTTGAKGTTAGTGTNGTTQADTSAGSVSSAADGEGLAFTGGLPWAVPGLALMTAGGGLLALRRRGRRPQP